MEAFLNIKYKQVSVENYEELLKFMDVSMILRKAALAVNPVCELTRDGDTYTLTMSSSFRTSKTVFKLNEEFPDERPDGAKVQSIFTVEGNKLIQVLTEANGKKSKQVREYSADKMIMTSTSEGWDGTCVRVFEKV